MGNNTSITNGVGLEVLNNFANAFELVEQAKAAFKKAIGSKVDAEGEVYYDETIDESCGYTELCTIYSNGGKYFIKGENGGFRALDCLGVDELYDISVKIS